DGDGCQPAAADSARHTAQPYGGGARHSGVRTGDDSCAPTGSLDGRLAGADARSGRAVRSAGAGGTATRPSGTPTRAARQRAWLEPAEQRWRGWGWGRRLAWGQQGRRGGGQLGGGGGVGGRGGGGGGGSSSAGRGSAGSAGGSRGSAPSNGGGRRRP